LRTIELAVQRAQERMLAPIPKRERKRFIEKLVQLVELNNVHSRSPMGPFKAAGATTRSQSHEVSRARRPEFAASLYR
jgi:hypothetical protein